MKNDGGNKRGKENRKGKKKFVNEYDRKYIRNKRRAKNVIIGEVIRLDLYTFVGDDDSEEERSEGTWKKEESFIIAQLWNEEVSYETTLREY